MENNLDTKETYTNEQLLDWKYWLSVLNETTKNKFIGVLATVDSYLQSFATSISFVSAGDCTFSGSSLSRPEECFYFMSDCDFYHSRNLHENKKCSICMGNISIRGVAGIVDPIKYESHIMIDFYKNQYPENFKKYGNLPNQRLYKFIPSDASMWIYHNGVPYQVEIYSDEEGCVKRYGK